MSSTTPEDHDFWDEIILNDDGTPNMEAIYNELHDFRFLMNEASKVYSYVTCNNLSKTNYYASSVISVSEECVAEAVRLEVYEVLNDIKDGIRDLDEAIEEYKE